MVIIIPKYRLFAFISLFTGIPCNGMGNKALLWRKVRLQSLKAVNLPR